MIYFILGEDGAEKDKRILEFKQKNLDSNEAQKFDFEVLYSDKLSPETLKKSLLALPAIAKKRVILIHSCHKLSPANRKIIEEMSDPLLMDMVLILESAELTESDRFVSRLRPHAKIFQLKTEKKINVFDVTHAMTGHKPAEALRLVSDLLAEGVHPLQIMGGLVWFWGKLKEKVSSSKFSQGLMALQDADLNIKRSRLHPNYTIEVLIVKLCQLMDSDHTTKI